MPEQNKILIVDDEKIIRDFLSDVLNDYPLSLAENGKEAIEKLQQENYRLIITDLKMPEVGGIQVVKAVKKMNPNVCVIVITGYASLETEIECTKLGVTDYIKKPFTVERIRKAVKNVWEK